MTKADIYVELRKIGYAKQKALKLARTAYPYTVNHKFFDFYDGDYVYTVNTESMFVLRSKETNYLETLAKGYYHEFWEKVVA